jgi:membrane-bound lytic murein transglycosylase A
LAGRLRHPIRFVMLLPKSLDPVEATRAMPLPEPRPSEEIAQALAPKPEKVASKDSTKGAKKGTKGALAATEGSAERKAVTDTNAAPAPHTRPEHRKKSSPRRMRHHPPT